MQSNIIIFLDSDTKCLIVDMQLHYMQLHKILKRLHDTL